MMYGLHPEEELTPEEILARGKQRALGTIASDSAPTDTELPAANLAAADRVKAALRADPNAPQVPKVRPPTADYKLDQPKPPPIPEVGTREATKNQLQKDSGAIKRGGDLSSLEGYGRDLTQADKDALRRSGHAANVGKALGVMGKIGGTILRGVGALKGSDKTAAIGHLLDRGGGAVESAMGAPRKAIEGRVDRARTTARAERTEDRADRQLGVQEGQLARVEKRDAEANKRWEKEHELAKQNHQSVMDLRKAQLSDKEFEAEMRNKDSSAAKSMRSATASMMMHIDPTLSPEEAEAAAANMSGFDQQEFMRHAPRELGKTRRVRGGGRGRGGVGFGLKDKSLDRTLQEAANEAITAQQHANDAEAALDELETGPEFLKNYVPGQESEAYHKLNDNMLMLVQRVGVLYEGGKLAEGDAKRYAKLGVDPKDPDMAVKLLSGNKAVARRKIRELASIARKYAVNRAHVAGQRDAMEQMIDSGTEAEEKPAARELAGATLKSGQTYWVKSKKSGNVKRISSDTLLSPKWAAGRGKTWEVVSGPGE